MAINYPTPRQMKAAYEYAMSGSCSKAASAAGFSTQHVNKLIRNNAQMRSLINEYREHFHRQLCTEAETAEVR